MKLSFEPVDAVLFVGEDALEELARAVVALFATKRDPVVQALARFELELEVDVLVPAALENQITVDNAGRVKARIVAEAANGAEAGVEVTIVAPGSPAAQRGLRDGDVVSQVNRRSISNLAQFREVAGANRILFLRVERGDRSLMLQIR